MKLLLAPVKEIGSLEQVIIGKERILEMKRLSFYFFYDISLTSCSNWETRENKSGIIVYFVLFKVYFYFKINFFTEQRSIKAENLFAGISRGCCCCLLYTKLNYDLVNLLLYIVIFSQSVRILSPNLLKFLTCKEAQHSFPGQIRLLVRQRL